MPLKTIAVGSLGALLIGHVMFGPDECRKPNALEQAAVLKFATAERDALLTPLEKAGWTADRFQSVFDGFMVGNSAPIPPRPFGVCTPTFEAKLEIDPGSARGAELQRQAEALAKQGTTDATKKMFYTIELGRLQISSDLNSPYIREAFHTPTTRIDVPGVPLAYKQTIAASSDADSVHQITTVCVGNWQNWGTDTYVNYPFAHKPISPFVENACIDLQGLPEVVDAVTKQIDWTPLTAALTK